MKTKTFLLPALLSLSLLTPALALADPMPSDGQSPVYAEDAAPGTPLAIYTAKLKVNDPTLSYNGSDMTMGATPLLIHGTVYVPAREWAETVGADVAWDAASGETVVTSGDDSLTFWVGRDASDINGASVSIGSNVMQNEDGRVMVPLRFIAEQLGWGLDYSTLDWSVTLTKMMPE